MTDNNKDCIRITTVNRFMIHVPGNTRRLSMYAAAFQAQLKLKRTNTLAYCVEEVTDKKSFITLSVEKDADEASALQAQCQSVRQGQ